MIPSARFVPSTLQPTDEQFDIQTAGDRTLIVQANAGAAKTTTLALRIGEALAQGVAPERILVLTYTAPACLAMSLAMDRVGVPAEWSRRVRVQTFEQFAEDVLLGIEKQKVPRKSTPEDLAPVVMRAVHALDMEAEPGIVETFLEASLRLKGSLRRDLALWEGECLTDENAQDLTGMDARLVRLFGAYEALRYPPGDRSDRPVFRGEADATYDLARLLADPETDTPLHEIARWPRDLEEVLVDEMHDLNLAMFTLLRALLQTRPSRFCGVGDFDQVVHQTAGAERRFMDADVDLGPHRKVRLYPLTATRRFGAALAGPAGRLTGKKYADQCEHKTVVACQPYDGAPGSTACEDAVVECARRWQQERGGNMAGFGVVLRHPHQSVPIENALLRAGFPFRTLGFNSYLLQPEVLLVRALLAVAAGDFSHLEAESTRRRLVQAVVSFCGVRLSFLDDDAESPEQRLASAIDSVARDASLLAPFFEYQVMPRGEPVRVARLRAAIDVARSVSGPEMFPRLLDALQMDRLVHHVFVEQQRRADALAYLTGLKQAARQFKDAHGFFDSLNQAEGQLRTTASARNDARRATMLRKKTLTLATMVAVKGLEFDHVVVPRLAEGEFPARLSLSAVEERNLFYVAITRARERLTLLVDEKTPSGFIAAAGFSMRRQGLAE